MVSVAAWLGIPAVGVASGGSGRIHHHRVGADAGHTRKKQMAPAIIKELVKRFEDNATSYRSTEYKEFRLRTEFLDPFFEALGWDVANKSSKPEAFKDVILEDSLKIDDRWKAPDYAFRYIQTRKFFAEAKAPNVNILVDPAPAYQIRRYGWSAKLPVSVLINFDFLCIYDCRTKPVRSDQATKCRLLKIPFRDFVERWDEIFSLLSFEAVSAGRLDSYAATLPKTRGQEAVDSSFLKDIEGWRSILAVEIAKSNAAIDIHQLNFAVQQTIDRIVFLRIAEDRRLEQYGTLEGVARKPGVYKQLVELFKKADARYNSGLFHFTSGEKGRSKPDDLTLRLKISDAALSTIIRGLYYPASPYAFSVISADILGQVYEQFLGKVIVLEKGKAKVEEKPEVRKAGGVYYTPSYVVRHIVRSAASKALSSRGLKDLRGGKHPTFRLLDPACGSGTFLIEGYQFLMDWYLAEYARDPGRHSKGDRAAIYQGAAGAWQLTIAEKKAILLAHIFGVDKDVQAVEVTKLSLLLKALENENEDTVAAQIDMFKDRALPDLDGNIRCGNSLVGWDLFEHFDRTEITAPELSEINPFDWNEFEFFGRGEPFDVIVGNPPYGASLNEHEKQYQEAVFQYQDYQPETYLMFVEHALEKLLRDGGYCGLIIPNPWLTNILQRKVRSRVLASSHIYELDHFTYNVFAQSKATVDTEVVCFRKGASPKDVVEVQLVSGTDASDAFAFRSQRKQALSEWRKLNGDPVNIYITDTERKLSVKVRQQGSRLDSQFNIAVGFKPYQTGKGVPKQTAATVSQRTFDAATKIDATYRQYLRGEDITEFSIAAKEKRFIKYGACLAEPRPKANFDAPIKVLVRQTGDTLIAAVDRKKFIGMNNLHFITGFNDEADAHYVCGLLNSQLFRWLFRVSNPEMGEALAEVKKDHVAQLPIPERLAASAVHNAIIKCVVAAISAKTDLQGSLVGHQRTLVERDLAGALQRLDKHVFDAFGLTQAEREVVSKSYLLKNHRKRLSQ